MVDLAFSPEHIYMITASFFALLLVACAFLLTKRQTEPYERLPSILTKAEQHFYSVLSSAIQDRALIFAKVRMADVIKVRRARTDKYFWQYFSRISQKHIDFVIVDKKTFTTLCLIELDDKCHAQADRIKRDIFINRIMDQTGIPLHRIPVRHRYDRAVLLDMLKL